MAAAFALPLAGLAMALAGVAGSGAVAVAILVAVLLLAVSLPGVFSVPDDRAATVVIALSGGSALILTLIEDERNGGLPDGIAYLAPVLGLLFFAAVVAQLVRRDGRADLVPSLSLTVTASALAALGTVWLPLSRTPAGSTGVIVTGIALGLAGAVMSTLDVIDAQGRARWGREVAALAVAGVGGAIGAVVDGNLGWLSGVLIGVLAGVVAVVANLFVVAAARERREAGGGVTLLVDVDLAGVLAAAVAVLLAAGPVFVLVRILVG
jgi:hypothetical protein